MILKKSEILTSNNNFHYNNVLIFQDDVINSEQVFILTTYFVQPDTICSTGRTATELSQQGTGTDLYFQNGPTSADVITPPKNRADAIAQGWTKNNCMFRMGWHNFYKVEEYANTNCLEIRPVFLIFNNKDQLRAFGYVAFGQSSSYRFESPDRFAIKAIVGSSAPQCMYDLAEELKLTSFHVYLDSYPEIESCTPSPFYSQV